MIMPKVKSPNQEIYRPRSAIDVSTGFGAEAFLVGAGSGNGTADPWARHCFVSMVEALLNHPQFRYPFPSRHSAQHGEGAGLPTLMVGLQNCGLLQPDESMIAEDIPLDTLELDTLFRGFEAWAANRRAVVKCWIQFHSKPEMKQKHKTQMPKDLNPAVRSYFERDRKKFERLARLLAIGPSRAAYAFDVAVRGRQYASLLGTNANYYSHPIREPILSPAENARHTFKRSWSWGRHLAWARRAGRIGREPEQVITLLSQLKNKIVQLHGTVPELANISLNEQQQTLNQIAAEAGLPGVLREDVHHQIERFFEYVHLVAACVDVRPIHLSVAAGSFIANKLNNIPGALVRSFPFFRGLVEYPFLRVSGDRDFDYDPEL
jgi:hypothetical protein